MTMASAGQLVKPEPKAVVAALAVKQEVEVEHASSSSAVKKRERSDSEEESSSTKKSRPDEEDDAGVKQADGSILFDLSSKKQVSVRAWKSAILVDIREYYDSNGERKPGKKGISLTKEQWNTVVTLLDDIEVAVKWVQNPDKSGGSYAAETLSDVEPNSVAFAVSNKRRVSVRKFKSMVLVDIREYYDANGTMKPGNKGISLTKEQWKLLKGRVDAINAAMTALDS